MYQIMPAAYIFTHQYLNTMQQGIQSLHVVGEFIAEYGRDPTSDAFANVMDWAVNHKVVRILNGGVGEGFHIAKNEAYHLAKEYDMPVTHFEEPDVGDPCEGMTTAFGFIVTPEVVFRIEEDRAAMLDDVHPDSESMDEYSLVQFLKNFNSAR